MLKKYVNIGLIVSLLLGLFLTSYVWFVPQAKAEPAFKVLVFSKTAGFRHDSITAGIAAIQSMGAASNFQVTVAEDASLFTTVNLAQYSSVIFLMTTGDVLNAAQQTAFEGYIRSGKGFVGIHSASDTEYTWPWYGSLVGSYFDSHPAVMQANIKVADQAHPSTSTLPKNWTRTDEWYNFKSNPRGAVHVLATLDETTYTGGNMGYDHPIAWCQRYEGGRSWYTGGGHEASSFSETAFKQHILGGILWASGQSAGDCSATVFNSSNYAKQEIITGANAPVAFDITDDGRVYYIERTTGKVQVYKPATSAVTTAATLPVFSGNEDGLMGIALDPNFITNGFLYLYYSPAGSTAVNRLSRFTAANDVIDLSSEIVMLNIPVQRTECCHSAGDLRFSSDGNLYLSTGDNVNPFDSNGYTPIDERAGRSAWDAQGTSANTNDLRGKILRVKPQANGTYTIPAGNLFPSGGGKPEIYVMGNRNPYRISLNPYNNTLYWGEVGPDALVDSDSRGPMGYDEFNMAATAGNYGWPYCIGWNWSYRDYNFASGASGAYFNCNAPVNQSPNNTGALNLPAARAGMIFYPYGQALSFPEISDQGGRTALAGPMYKYDSVNPSVYKFPAYFDKSLFVFDFSRNWFKELKFDDSGNLHKINPFLMNISFDHPIYARMGKDGQLYVSEYATGGSDGKISRILYTGGVNAPPTLKAEASVTSGLSPLSVNFDTAGTMDINGDSYTFAWDLDGNGTVDSASPNPQKTYTANGIYNAQVTVTDSNGASATKTIPITVGNNAPVVKITAPTVGGFYKWGDVIPFRVTVTDAQDTVIDCATRVSIVPALGHDTHSHPGLTQYGCSGTITTVMNDTNLENSYYLITASYTDNGGVGGIYPLTSSATIRVNSTDRQSEYYDMKSPAIKMEPTADIGGGKNIGSISNNDWIGFKSWNLANLVGVSARVASPLAGGSIEMRADSTTGTLLATLAVPNTGGWQTWTTVSAQLANAPVGVHDIYFVFKSALSDNLMNVNKFDLLGNGISLQSNTVAIKAGINGKFVSAPNGGANSLIADHAAITLSEQYDMISLANGNVVFKSKANNKYVVAAAAGASPLTASSTSEVDPWSEFLLIDALDGKVALRSAANNKYVTASGSGSGALIASSTSFGAAEKFTILGQDTATVSLYTNANGKYVTAEDAGNSPLIASRAAVSTWELFSQTALANGTITLKSNANGKFVAADYSGSIPLIANRAVADTWEQYQQIFLANGYIALQAISNGKYVTAEDAGNSALINSRTGILGWELFKLFK
ncbi:ThuA domain-containing protein [Cohnella silvisoli]|uniref:ThuA domain-containing protein n=1 Tax=Cohnella silvisoli TaxID=2873699 RepID=A0ABV1KNN0_9BACL|nr:ThuA domain-containing protein [Cohnella silvisoli]MCD9020607.1 ThuA domain-containing protein [Cohnella silvisoli]